MNQEIIHISFINGHLQVTSNKKNPVKSTHTIIDH